MALAIDQARTNVRFASGLDIVAGLWMIVAPFVLGYSAFPAALWNSVIAGAAIVLLAGSRETREGYKHSGPSWLNAAIGVWLLVSPFFLAFSAVEAALWNHVIIGIAVIVFALWSALATPHERM